MRRSRHYVPEEPPGGPRPCDHAGCGEHGTYRAPRSRSSLRQYYYFCLEHVREYNAAWDYFRGMSPGEIERLRRADIVGDRPSWPLGQRAAGQSFDQEAFARAFRQFFDGADPEPPPQRRRPRSPREEALAVLELSEDCTFAEVKRRYKELVKRHHPDANGGDKAAEERLKSINQAYSVLKVQAAQP